MLFALFHFNSYSYDSYLLSISFIFFFHIVMAFERIPAYIRYDGGVARMSDPEMIKEIKQAVTIPIMAKVCGNAIVFFFTFFTVHTS